MREKEKTRNNHEKRDKKNLHYNIEAGDLNHQKVISHIGYMILIRVIVP
jgi:hypothetical protein